MITAARTRRRHRLRDARPRCLTAADDVAFLATVPLLDGHARGGAGGARRACCAGAICRRGEVLWREGDEAKAMVLIVDGRVSVSLRLPGDRTVEVDQRGARRGARRDPAARRRAPLGHGARDRAGDALLSLSRADFAALVSRRHPTAFALKRRIAGVALRAAAPPAGALAASLGEDGAAGPAPPRGRARVMRAAGQRLRAPAGDLPRLRLARAVGFPDRRPLRALPGRAHPDRRGRRRRPRAT